MKIRQCSLELQLKMSGMFFFETHCSYSTCPVTSGLLQRHAGQSSSFHTGTIPVSPAHNCMHCYGSQAVWPCDSSSSRVELVASRWEDPVQAVLAGSQVASGTHSRIYLRPSDIGCQYSRLIYTACFIMWQPHRAADTSTSLFRCCTMSMEQATNGAETAAIDGLVSLWSDKKFCFILSSDTKIRIDSVMRPRSSSRGRNTSASVTIVCGTSR